MTSDSFIKDQLFKVKSIFPNPLSFRQTGSTTTQGDGSQSSVERNRAFRSISRSSTANLLVTGSDEPKNDHGAGHTSSPGDPSPSTHPRTVNVVLFGETGVGKSSVINLIARKEVAKVSSDVNGCTMQSTRYDIPFGGMTFAIFDTIGLEEPQMGINGYLKAIEKAYELIVKLGAAGGIHLLLFCMRGGRITATTQSNYRLFCECLCNTKVPIALVFTGLEREEKMEDWWTRNKTHIEHYGIKSHGHACITAVEDEVPGEDRKYTESRESIRELLKTCALKNEAFLPEPHTWFAKFGKGMKSFIEKHRNPKRRDVMRVLTNRCKLDPETARKIADMMEKGDTETKDGNQDEQAGNREGEVMSNPVVVKKNAAKPDALRNQPGDVEAVPRNDAQEEEVKSGLVKKTAAKPDALRNQQSGVEAGSCNDALEGEDTSERVKKSVAKPDALRNQPGDVEAHTDAQEGEDKSGLVKEIAAKPDALRDQPGAVEAGPRNDALEREDKSGLVKKIAAKPNPDALWNQPGAVEAEPPTDALEGEDKSGFVKIAAKPKPDALRNQPGAVEAEPPTDALEGEDKSGSVKKIAAKLKPDALEGEDKSGHVKKIAAEPEPDALRNMPGAFEAEPHTDALEGKDKSEVANKKVARGNAPAIQHGGRPKMNDGDQSLDMGAVVRAAKAKRDGTKKTSKSRATSTVPFS